MDEIFPPRRQARATVRKGHRRTSTCDRNVAVIRTPNSAGITSQSPDREGEQFDAQVHTGAPAIR
jgi:hypothetical protein